MEIVLIIGILAILILPVIPASIAKKRGYSAVGFYFFGLFLFVPALIVALVIQDKQLKFKMSNNSLGVSNGLPPSRQLQTVNTSRGGAEQYCSGSPLLLISSFIVKNDVTKQRFIRYRFQNLTKTPVVACYIGIECWSVDGSLTRGVEQSVYMDLRTGQGGFFGDETLIPLPDLTTTKTRVLPKKVVFADGSVWEQETPLPFQRVAPPTPLNSLGEFEAQYRRDAGPAVRNLPSAHQNYWRCRCGQICPSNYKSCLRCRTPLSSQLAGIDKEVLKQHLSEFEQEETRLNDLKRRNDRVAIIIGSGLIGLVVLIVVVGILVSV